MEVRVQIPDDVAAKIQGDGGDLPQNALETHALEGYKSGQFSAYQVQKILGFETSMEVNDSSRAMESIWITTRKLWKKDSPPATA